MKSGARRWGAAYAGVVVAFLAACATYYHPPYGFTAFLEFPGTDHVSELPVVRELPHYHSGSTGYDGQFYSQLAIEPLLRDPAIDTALDNPSYRAHRILFSWTAYALGLGRPGWILHVYSVQNIIGWMALAWLLWRLIPPVSARAFALWSGCLLSHGLLISVRYALPDGPSALLIALAAVVAERDRPVITALIVGVSGLARETNLLAISLLGRFLRDDRRRWWILAGCVLLCLLPFALWMDYLRSIYRAHLVFSSGNITTPFTGLIWKLKIAAAELQLSPMAASTLATLCALVGLLVQMGYGCWAVVKQHDRSPWALMAGSFVVLALIAHPVVWQGSPGAFTRVLLPLTIAVNVLLARQPPSLHASELNASGAPPPLARAAALEDSLSSRGPRALPPWWLILSANLGVVPGIMAFGFRTI